ncbi:MAG: COX15/CtaA family protein [Hellea sp.]|nr:COX15/CtaA family protein [Hellea sp.]
MASTSSLHLDKGLIRWLMVMVLLVIAMIVLGGATRLTNSGLSITEWEPIKGAFPPLSLEQWQAEFEKYKQIPEFAAENSDMKLQGFKSIYFWEWAHRLLGRIIGLAYALPLFFFLIKSRIPSGKRFRFVAILLLIGLQGFIGWWMVASGLTDNRVDVSQYRLAIHLGLAFIILGFLYWTLKDLRQGWGFRRDIPASPILGGVIATLVFCQIIAGALVAGTKSGKIYNEWPLMDGKLIPNDYFFLKPFWLNFGENSAAVQFNHRLLAYIIFGLAIIFWLRVRKITKIRAKALMFLILIFTQMALGIWTLLQVAPLNLSLAHQFLAVFVFLSAIGLWRGSRIGY